ncbi:MAG: hypothetical protein KKA32_08265 [Actinobacteria bacterium]|nr:hypothetical protein [Actinomycetota bacterium]
MSTASDTVSLTIPRAQEYLPLFNMLLGGIATRRVLSLEALDDLQLAVDNVILEDRGTTGDLSLAVTLLEEALEIVISPLSDPDLHSTLIEGSVSTEAADRCLDVCLLLSPLVDRYVVHDLDSGTFALELRKLLR